MIATLMEGDTSSSNRLISSITNFKSESKQNGALKTLLKSFILPETDMAIKHNQNDKCVYTVPVTLPITERMKSINEAKMAFLKSTVNHPTAIHRNDARKEESSIHYAQIAIATATDDPRSTGGGKDKRDKHHVKTKDNSPHIHISPTITRLTDQHQRKVSFKTKKGSASYKRPPIATKTMTITSTKVSELTKKFNGLQNESCDGVPIPKKLVKTLEDLTTASRCSASNSSTPSSTLSSSPNIKIVLRHRRGSKKRSSRKRCSSMDSIDKLVLSDTSAKIRVIRSKSDGTKIPKSPKKCLKYQDSSEQHSGPDCVDGNLSKTSEAEEKDKQSNRNSQSNVVKNVIKKFECEIIAQSSSSNTIKQSNGPKITPPKEKPKVPEKKTSLVLTKNIVVKDGVAKFKTVKAPVPTESRTRLDKSTSLQPPTEISKKKDPIYDRKKYKTNYIHTEKLPLKVVEIIPEDINESNCSLHSSEPNEITNHSMEHNNQITPASKDDKTTHVNEDVNSEIAPNDSFLWRRKSTTPIYGDPDNNESPYCFISITMNETTDLNSNNSQQDISVTKQSQTSKPIESQAANEQKSVQNLDFESNLVEAYNKEVLVGFTSKSENKPVVEDDYEVLEPIDITNIVVIPVKTADRNSKVNCPLPEIPKSTTAPETPDEEKENIYQCLLEMRSHPEGDESSLHNYELCDNALEERTRGDGDSDDGYEYCKSPIKPYCRTSSAGIQIAEDYTPSASDNDKNYTITKSVSGTSTVSYEKIGPERIYEKISHLNSSPKSKGSSPTYSSRHSFMSDYTGYNDNENIYDTIKHSDGASLSHCYESIPNSPSMVKLRNNLKKQLNSAVQKRLSFDTVSNISQSTLSSEQKTNSIYGQRSVISFNGQEIAFQVPSSETSVSDRSDRSDDWVDVSDEEKNDEQKIEIIVQEKSRGRKSPISWSQKVRHQWQKSPKKSDDRECDSSDSGHVYESLEPPGAPAIAPHLDSDSFDSDSDDDGHETPYAAPPSLPPSRLPTPPSGGQYTLTKIASAAQRKMRQIKRNLTKRYSVAMDGIPHFNKSAPQNGIYDTIKSKPTSPVYENYERPEIDHVYSNVAIPEKKTDKLNGAFKDELKTVISDKRLNDPPPLPDKPQEKRDRERSVAEKPVTPNSDVKKDGTLSRKAYFSFKSRFRRATSVAVDINDIPSALKITNSTFYITDSMDGDSGFSNCSDNGQAGSSETLARRRDGTRLRAGWAESSPCLAIERPNVPPPPPPVEPMPLNSNNTSTPNNSSQSNHYEVASVTSSGVVTSSGASSSRTSVIYGRASVASSGASVTSGGASVTPYGVPVTSSGGSGIYGRASDASSGASVTLYGVPVTSSGSLVTSSGASVTSSGVVTSSTSVSPRPPTDLSAVNEELKRLLPTLSRKDKSPRARTSWYAECGGDVTPTQPSSTSWYAETGLYEAGNVSTSSGASSGSHPASPLPHSLFTHEPLYQFYNAAKVESVCRETGDSDSDAYESSPGVAPPPPATASASAPATAPTPAPAPARPSAMALVAPRGPARTLWCEVPEVVNSTVLNSLSPAEKRLQEAKFELLTSEASYLNSLNVLEAHFIAHPAFRDPHILPRGDWETLFSNILPVRKCSQLLMNELEKCWQENILLQGICDIVRSHAEEHFHVYVKYCENQALMVKALQRLRERPNFAAALKRLESHAACQSLSLHSFLLLPMQRVTRLPLLMDAVLRHLPSHSTDYSACMHALATLNHFVMQCNEGARSTERVEEMFRLARVIEFPPHVRRAPLLGPACERRDRRPVRWLVRSGEMTQLVWKADELKLTFGRKFHKVPLYVFLFNDLLVITKRKSEEQYIAVDHCSRSLLEVSSGEGSGAAAGKHALLLTLLENHEGRTIEMLMSLSSETEVSRWSEALCPPSAGAEGEAVYAGWDCPQVCALYAYTPAQPDELPLTEGDIVNVTRKTNEGWYYGERTRDGEAGWFPGSYTAEIASPHVRARNLRQRYRLLALSGTYFGQKKK